MRRNIPIFIGCLFFLMFFVCPSFSQQSWKERVQQRKEERRRQFRERFEKRAARESVSTASLFMPDQEFFLHYDGLDRRYLVHLPSSYDGEKAFPVVLNFHGGGGSAEYQQSKTRMNEKADEAGFIVVYPEGSGGKLFGKYAGAWNTETCCGKAARNNVDDVGFVSKMIDKLAEDFYIDKNKIYATGLSNGAAMSYRLACELSDKIAAIAPVAYSTDFSVCEPKRPVPILHIHGMKDPCATYNEGKCGACFQDMMKNTIGIRMGDSRQMCLGVPKLIDRWIKRNKLSSSRKIIVEEKGVTCMIYGFGEEGEIVLCTDENMGHVWPGVGNYTQACKGGLDTEKCQKHLKVLGPFSDAISANDMIWDFFQKHRLEKQ